MKILVAVDGSKHSLHAVRWVIDQAGWYRRKPELILVTVHLPVPKLPRMGLAVGKSQIRRYYEEEGAARLAAARRKLDGAGLRYAAQVLVGPVAESIVKFARQRRCDLICIGTRGMTDIGNVLLGSTASKVLQLSATPVLLVK